MCFIRPLKVKKVARATVVLEDGIRARYDKKIGEIKINDKVLVFGNLVIEKFESAHHERDSQRKNL